MPSDMHDYRTNGVGQHRPERRVPARSECDVSEPRLLRRRAARGIRALSGVAARARAPAGAVSRPPARRAARGGTSRARRLRRRRSGRSGLRPERERPASTSPHGRSGSSRGTRSCRRTSSTARSTWPGSTSAATSARATSGLPIRLPVTSAEEVADTIWAGVGPRTKVLFISHYTSETAFTLPVAELCRRARERGIRTVVDGAHVPGHLPLDLPPSTPTTTAAIATSGFARPRVRASSTCGANCSATCTRS